MRLRAWMTLPALLCALFRSTSNVSVADPVEAPGDSIASRIAGRTFPSVFEAWNPAQNLHRQTAEAAVSLSTNETAAATTSRHDLYFGGWNSLGLKLTGDQRYALLSPDFTADSIEAARKRRAVLLAANPNMLILAEQHYYSAGADFLPPDSPWWRRDSRLDDPEHGSGRLDFGNPAFQDKVAALCGALVRTGVYDGCMLDWWHDDDQSAERLALIRKIRAAVGEQAILLGNVNSRLPARTAGYLNGMYMEGFGSHSFPDWHMAAANLIWGESHLRKPVVTALEGWWDNGRNQYPLMRNVTTLCLVFSNGYVLFSDPNSLPTPDHLHDWYPFWDKSLGRPIGPPAVLNHPDLSGAYTRQFDKGEVVFNPPSNKEVTVRFEQSRRSAASGATGRVFTIAPGDGDLLLE